MLRLNTRIGLSFRNVFRPYELLSSNTTTGSLIRPLLSLNHLHARPDSTFAAPASRNLSWDEFLRLRRQRRLSGIIASIPTSMLGICGGILYFGSEEIDPAQTILGFDPYFMNAAFVLGCGILGWLAGPTVGRGAWHLFHRRQAHLVKEVIIANRTSRLTHSERDNSTSISRRIGPIRRSNPTVILCQTITVHLL
jgi:hypothetical protein